MWELSQITILRTNSKIVRTHTLKNSFLFSYAELTLNMDLMLGFPIPFRRQTQKHFWIYFLFLQKSSITQNTKFGPNKVAMVVVENLKIII
ncbi:hypothetical protein LEP1GSC172_0026 [Leptospira noguchii]|uniref:Uncharacterized protein n=2 Tax=Leptospira noguchii TaxID=28182 RepID=T0FFH4_9LEPT|nr:hypothetical protein LEP1GSC172_0026 [Leptospira noguchii]EQA72008.1 hypothetical protein LEP1GSC059_1102 [Leptospira noguchii serovar Panama str. CZ214]